MCGIVGYVGYRQAQQVLTDCLSRLEYRGYDSCGIAISGSQLEIFKDAVRVEALVDSMPQVSGTSGIGHTRWATHGEPSKINAHPHCDCRGKVAVVHNGIINNYHTLRQELSAEGHTFSSETDSEVIPHLIEKYYTGSLESALKRTLERIQGSYAIVLIAANQRKVVATRQNNPLVIGLGNGENFLASDVPAILDYTDRIIYLEDGDICTISDKEVDIQTRTGEIVHREARKADCATSDISKGGFEHYMIKEIREEPRVIRETISHFAGTRQRLDGLFVNSHTPRLLMLACGTSYHAALIGRSIIQDLVGVPVQVETASEFNYNGQASLPCRSILITQSGETADVLHAIRKVKSKGYPTVVVTNVIHSTASRIADQVVYTKAGPEMSVAATKTFIAQLITLYLLAISHLKEGQRSKLLGQIRQLPSKVEQILYGEEKIKQIAFFLSHYKDIFFIGRGINYPVALEGALKMKEISYIHAEGFAAGELKHGPFALLDGETPVVAVLCQDNTYEAMVSNIKEIKARRSPVIVLAEEGNEIAHELADAVIETPSSTDPLFSPIEPLAKRDVGRIF